MFNFSRKRRQRQMADEMMIMACQAAEEIKKQWLSFDNTLPFKEKVTLSKKIDLFIEPVLGFFEEKYPVLLLGGGRVFWFTIATAILESGTHPKSEVTKALEGLSHGPRSMGSAGQDDNGKSETPR